jgi:hypothetical protein
MALDPLDQALDGRVRPDGPASATLAMRSRQAGLESFLVRLLECPFEHAPVAPLELAQRLTLRHPKVPPGVRKPDAGTPRL